MCGIVGIVHRDRERPVDGTLLRSMAECIRHRGPDEDGFLLDGPVGLAMRRLSIIDLTDGRQPIYNEDGTKGVVYNGEIYNYRELREELLARGHTLRTKSDTETIVHLFEELGPECVSRLRGMFAFALWDRSEETLLLARDRFGIKPLYVTEGDFGIAFASELKALHAAGMTGGELDWQALDAYFHLGYVPAPATPFRAVRKLEPGHLLIWRRRDGQSLHRRYWDLPSGDAAEPDGGGPALERRVLEWIDDSVRAHLVSDVPVAAFLSGGLDSSAVVSSMALAGETPHAYTARFRGSGADATDETPLARALAARYGARLTVVDVEPDVETLLEPIVAALDEPHADESAIPTWLLSERVARDYKVVLVGTGGDELFGGYPRHLGLLLGEWWSRVPAPLRRMASSAAALVPEPRSGQRTVHRLKGFLRAGSQLAPERYFEMQDRLPDGERRGVYAGALAAAVGTGGPRERFVELWREGGAPSGLRAALYLDTKTFLPDDILHLSDRISMAHSLEVRVPFVDHQLAERVFPLTDRTKVGPGRLKHLLRRALRSRLPEEHFAAPKRGFIGPTAVWLRHELRDMVTDELSPARMARLGILDPRAVERLLDDHLTLRQNRQGILWALLCFSTWHRLFVEAGAGRTAGGHTGAALPANVAGGRRG